MFRNGIYRIDYRNPLEDRAPINDALVVLRDGKLIGADRHGGIYTGEPRCFAGSRTVPNVGLEETIALKMTAPPGGELVTGQTIWAAGASFELTGRFDPTRDRQSTTIDVGGAPVEVVVSYLGPLPG